MSFYILRGPTSPDWGDYSDILIKGMAARSEESDLLELERTGPFIPPLTTPGLPGIVVTDQLRIDLEGSGLSGLAFRPVIKKHIVHLEWEKWNWSADDPQEYPESGEPEDYLLQRPHSAPDAEALGLLWELHLEEHAEIERVGSDMWDQDISILSSTWDGTDLFRAKGVLYDYVSENARAWIQQTIPKWVSFEEARSK